MQPTPLDLLIASFATQFALASVILVALWGIERVFRRPMQRALALGWSIYLLHIGASLLNAIMDRQAGGATAHVVLATIQLLAVLGACLYWFTALEVLSGRRSEARPPHRVAFAAVLIACALLGASVLGGRVLHQPGTGPFGPLYAVPFALLAWHAWRRSRQGEAHRGAMQWMAFAFVLFVVRLVLIREVVMPEAVYAQASFARVLAVALIQMVQMVAVGVICLSVGLAYERAAVIAQAERLLQAELRVQKALRLETLGRMTTGIAHDFNNVLTVVRTSVDLVADEAQDRTAVRRELLVVAEAVERASDLTRRLLDFARPRRDTPGGFDADGAVAAAAPMLERLMPHGIALTVETAARHATVLIDGTQFDQILLNLVINGRDATSQGTIAVRTAVIEQRIPLRTHEGTLAPDRYYTLSVSDTGSGIPPEVLPRIFEPFFTTKPTGVGTGIGLATVYQAVHAARGDITVDSVVGAGTRFVVYLPCAPRESA